MKFEDLKNLYLEKTKQYGAEAYKHISELLSEAKEVHRQDWLNHPLRIFADPEIVQLRIRFL